MNKEALEDLFYYQNKCYINKISKIKVRNPVKKYHAASALIMVNHARTLNI